MFLRSARGDTTLFLKMIINKIFYSVKKQIQNKQKTWWKSKTADGFLKSRQQTKSLRLLFNVCD